jgi:hypothetical protein
MSLEVAAKYLAAHGRGPDDQLVHMSGKEVAGLQALAKAAGGSLTINPHTGLTEAGFLDDIAPLVIGAGLAAATGGASLGFDLAGSELLSGLSPEILGTIGGLSNEALIGGGLGLAGTVLSGGNLGQGLRYGLGGYGGASLAGMAGAGAPAPTPTEAASATPGGAQAVNTQVAQPIAGSTATQPAFTDFGEGVAPQSFATTAAAPAAGPSMLDNALTWAGQNPGYVLAGLAAPSVLNAIKPKGVPTGTSNPQMIRPYTYASNQQMPANMIGARYVPGQDTSERMYFNPQYTALPPYKAADGGIIALAGGGPVEQMSNENAIGANTGFPQAYLHNAAYATPYQTPMSQNVLTGAGDTRVDPYTGEEKMAAGGITDLGGYSDGGRLLRGPGDGVSDSIPAQIGNKQPARLADGEFVVPARIVSELGNGSTEAGAKQLYKMLDRVQQARAKTTGKNKVAHNSNAAKYLPA